MPTLTETITRPTQPARPRTSSQGSVVLSGVVSALGAASLGLLACLSLVVTGWSTDPNSSGTSAGLVKAAGQLWLLAHGGSLLVGADKVTLAPLGITAVIVVFAVRGAGASLRRSQARGRRNALVAAFALGPPYALLVAVVTRACRTDQVRPLPTRALVGAVAITAVAAVVAVVRRDGWDELTRGWPPAARAVPQAVAAAVAVVVCTGALLVAASLAADSGQVTAIARTIQGAGPAGFALLLVQIALAPNAAIWASAYAAGTGFAVGTATNVSQAGVALGAVPGLPLLGALPASGPAPAVATISLAGVLAAGVVAGLIVERRLAGSPQHEVTVTAAVAAAVAGVILALVTAIAGGALPGRLATLGPDPLATGAIVAQWLVLTAVPAAWISSWLRTRHAR